MRKDKEKTLNEEGKETKADDIYYELPEKRIRFRKTQRHGRRKLEYMYIVYNIELPQFTDGQRADGEEGDSMCLWAFRHRKDAERWFYKHRRFVLGVYTDKDGAKEKLTTMAGENTVRGYKHFRDVISADGVARTVIGMMSVRVLENAEDWKTTSPGTNKESFRHRLTRTAKRMIRKLRSCKTQKTSTRKRGRR